MELYVSQIRTIFSLSNGHRELPVKLWVGMGLEIPHVAIGNDNATVVSMGISVIKLASAFRSCSSLITYKSLLIDGGMLVIVCLEHSQF